MTDAPENITLKPNHLFGNPWSNAYIDDDDPMEDGEDTSYGYTRTDVADARIAVLEALLLRAEDTIGKSWVTIYPAMEEEFNTDGSWHVVQDIRAALKGEDK
jgi:hypothetical protein